MALNLHIYPSPFQNETRMLKILRSLAHHKLFDRWLVIALHKPGLAQQEQVAPAIAVRRVAPFLGGGKVTKALSWYLAALWALRGTRVACVNAHSLPVLPLCWAIARWKGAKLIYDTHELETETMSCRGLRQRLARVVERLFIHRCDAVSVVGPAIAQWYKDRYGLAQVTVVRNVPYALAEAKPSGALRAALGLDAAAEIYLYQGLLSRGRGIEMLLQAFETIDAPKHLVFMGYGELEPMIREAAAKRANIHFHAAVPPEQIPHYTADATVGLALIEPRCLSYYYCLPNKLFEYAACNVPVLASDLPEMQHVLRAFDAGWAAAPEAEAIAQCIAGLTPEAIATKKAQLPALAARYRWENEEPMLLAMYANLGFTVSA